MIEANFLIDFEAKFKAAAIASGVLEKNCLLGVNKTDLAESAKRIPVKQLAFINIYPDFNFSGTDNDQLADQADLLLFFLQKIDLKTSSQRLQVMNDTLNALMRFRDHILTTASSCDWMQRLDWPAGKIAPESNLYEMSGWMLALKTRPI